MLTWARCKAPGQPGHRRRNRPKPAKTKTAEVHVKDKDGGRNLTTPCGFPPIVSRIIPSRSWLPNRKPRPEANPRRRS